VDGGLTSDSPDREGCTDDEGAALLSNKPRSFTEAFEQACPYYLYAGMTYDQYWHGEPKIAEYYRKADRMRKEAINEQLWLQGMYVYEAICDAQPIFNPFAKRGTKPKPYSERSYPLDDKQRKEREIEHQKSIMSKGMAMMRRFAMLHNKKNNAEQNKDK